MVKWHILGVGAIGQLVAHNLRKRGDDVVLLLRSAAAYDSFEKGGRSICVERQIPQALAEELWPLTKPAAPCASRTSLPGIVSTSLSPCPVGGLERMVVTERTTGFQVEVLGESVSGDHEIAHGASRVTDTPGVIENLLVTVKAHQTRSALVGLKNRLKIDSTIVLLQNGMGVKEEIEHESLLDGLSIGGRNGLSVVTAITTHGCSRAPGAPFCIQHNTIYGDGRLWFGFTDDEASRASATGLGSLKHLDELGAELIGSRDLRDAQQMKLLANCCINPLTGLLGCRNGELLKSEEARRIMLDVCREGTALFTSMGREPMDAELVFRAVLEVAKTTESNVSSMLQDITNKRQTEIDYMNGFLSRASRDLNLPSPANAMLWQLVRAKTDLAGGI